MLRKAVLVISGHSLASLLALTRNLIIARLIPLSDYGIATTFMILVSIMEMVSNFGLNQRIVQARDGDDPRLQAALQGFQVFRGTLSALAILLLAEPVARFMNLPEIAWAYRLLALVPLFNAFQSLDAQRLTRQMRFGPMMLTATVPAAVALLAVWPLAAWTQDYQVMLYAILIHAGMIFAMTHLVAERPYRLSLDREQIRRTLAFGWPLLVNSLLLFGVYNGDRVIVGRELGTAELAIFSMGMTLTLTPTLVLAGSMQNVFLPRLSEIDRALPDGEVRFIRLASIAVEAYLLVGITLVTGAVLFGPALVQLLLGEKYAALSDLIVWFAVIHGLLMFKGGPSTIALARGRTENALIANLVRVGLIPLAWWVAVTTGSFRGLIFIAIVGEAAGYLVSFLVLRWRIGFSLRPVLLVGLSAFSCISAAVWAGFSGSLEGRVVVTFLFLIALTTMTRLLSYIRSLRAR